MDKDKRFLIAADATKKLDELGYEPVPHASIRNLALHPRKPLRKLPTGRTLRGRLQRAWLALTGWELYGN